MTDNANLSPRRGRRILWWVLGGLVALVVLVYGAIFLYANVFNDTPDALDESDLGAALAVTTPIETAGTVAVTTPIDTADTTLDDADGFDGTWTATGASEFGYRVDEVLAGVNVTAAGRSNEVDGFLTIDGTSVTAVDVAVQVDTITSDDNRRDNQFRGRIMSTSEFPTATFVLTEPIELGAIPTGDQTITATATGELTLRGVTNVVTFEVTAQTTAGRIGVLGSIPVVFEDYGIANPSMPGITTEDHGEVEFVLVFER